MVAIQIEFRGYVNEVRTFDWGTSYSVSHNQVKKTPDGKWETIGKDYFSVVGPAGFQENDQVTVKGTLKTKFYDKKDGSGKGVALQVRAQEMNRVDGGTPGQGATPEPTVQQLWPEVKQIPDNAPF